VLDLGKTGGEHFLFRILELFLQCIDVQVTNNNNGEEKMTLTINDLKVGSLVVGMNGKMGVVVGHELNRPKHPIMYKNSPDGATYIAGADYFKAILGSVDMDAFNNAAIKMPIFPNIPAFVPASREPLFGTDIEHIGIVPVQIAEMKLKSGDQIQVRHGSRVITVEFSGFNWNRPKYPVSYTINGKKWKGPLSVIIGKA